jgi:hypothetical protein
LPGFEVLRLLAGHTSTAVVVFLLVLALVGAWRFTVERNAVAFAAALAVLAQVGLVVATAPTGIEGARIVGRYLLPVWPWVLLWVARGAVVTFQAAYSKLAVDPRWALPTALAGVLLLFGTGPLSASGSRYSSFLHQQDWLGFTRPWRSTRRLPMPAAYRALGETRGAVIEFPMHDRWALAVAAPNYQRVHRRPVLVSRVAAPWVHAALDL